MINFIVLGSLIALKVLGLALIVRQRRRLRRVVAATEVCRQYVYLFRGGYLSESAVQSARAALEPLLQAGDLKRVEASLRPGKQYTARVRALAEIGTETARGILERQLERPIGDDPLEQSWYRLDLARCLRKLNRLQSMPVLIRAAAGPEAPLTHFLAAEAACFPGFSGFMFQTDTPLGRAALLVLLRAFQGLHRGVEPAVVSVGRFGEALEVLWEQRLDGIDPLAVRLFVEARKLVGRAGHADRWFATDEARAAFHEQIERLAQITEGMADYLDEARDQLLARLPKAAPVEQGEILMALADLKADTAAVVVPLLDQGRIAAEVAVASLAHSPSKAVGPWLCRWLQLHTGGRKVSANFPHATVLRILRHHPSAEAESALLAATHHRDAAIRQAAFGSLGWWVPLRSNDVLTRIKEARFDRCSSVRVAAQAALARLGERQALRWFREQLVAEASEPVHRIIQLIADEGIVLLWPDLDALADAEDTDVAYHACEALEQLCEDLSRSGLPR